MLVHTGRLLLTPQDPFLVPDPKILRAGLAARGFLGNPLPGDKDAFRVGEHFFSFVVFAGCSVQIELAPPGHGDTAFCHIRIAGPYSAPRLVCGRNTRPPRCRSCRAPLRHWRDCSDVSGGRNVRCPTCGEIAPAWDWDWKEHAGWGRLFIKVEEVFPGEAMPAQGLMTLLANAATGAAWRHFYIQDP